MRGCCNSPVVLVGALIVSSVGTAAGSPNCVMELKLVEIEVDAEASMLLLPYRTASGAHCTTRRGYVCLVTSFMGRVDHQMYYKWWEGLTKDFGGTS